MLAELLVVLLFALVAVLVGWALFGLLLMPVFGADVVSLCFAQGDGEKLEQTVRAYGWLRDEKKDGGIMVIVDCGLTAQGRQLVRRLRENRTWLGECTEAELTHLAGQFHQCLENEEELL